MRIRTEDGAFIDSGKLTIALQRGWEWTRLETGEDVLLGPNSITVAQSAVARLGPGDIDVITIGTPH